MKRIRNNSSLLSKYTLMYEKKPRSRVFAPLAETYRKLGMIDEAMKVLKEGIKQHPSYTLGYIVLGHCYFDLQNFEMSYSSTRAFVSQNLENITLQRLFANTCLKLGFLEEALQTFKHLLLLNPKDKFAAENVALLEDDLLISEELAEFEDDVGVSKSVNTSFEEDDWVQVDFYDEVDGKDLGAKKEVCEAEEMSSEGEVKGESIENWNLSQGSPLESFKNQVQEDIIDVKEHGLDDEFYHEKYDNESENVIFSETENSGKETPIITHTLVDLYCKQGHFEQAAAILESILELHPNDLFTNKKLDEVTLILAQNALSQNESGEQNDEVIQNTSCSEDQIRRNDKLLRLEKIFKKYHKKLNSLALVRLGRI